MCRSRRELSNECLLAKIGVDTAENELLQVLFKIIQYYSIVSLVPPVEAPHVDEQRRYRCHGDVSHEKDEQLLVSETHAIVHPRAMVVHPEDATIANATMVRARGLPAVVAFGAFPMVRLTLHDATITQPL